MAAESELLLGNGSSKKCFTDAEQQMSALHSPCCLPAPSPSWVSGNWLLLPYMSLRGISCVCAVPLPSARSFGFSWVNTFALCALLFLKAIKKLSDTAQQLPRVSTDRGSYLQLTVAFLMPLRYAIPVQVSVFELYFTVKKYYKANSSSRELRPSTRASGAESCFHLVLP